MAVHRVIQEAGLLLELFVERDQNGFRASRPLSTCAISEYFASQQVRLSDGQRAEAGLEACDWIMEIRRRLERGFCTNSRLWTRSRRVVRCASYVGDNARLRRTSGERRLLRSAWATGFDGSRNFTALKKWGERAGLHSLGLVSQTSFLLAIGKGNDFGDLYDEGMDEADKVRARLQLKTLIYPEGMGERFQVLIQEKGVSGAHLTGLSGF